MTADTDPNSGPSGSSLVAVVKNLLRSTNGARDFIEKASLAGFRPIKEDAIGLYLRRDDCTLILDVLPSRGPDTIWCLSVIENKNSGIVNLIDEGKVTF